ncbi:hypothetical protein CDAR_526491 [Caerostris darwini]|uniref:Uncharacterized protein n=1 Tax=Caerostris darwini TaxID=1538125 RepID=A0AAV4T3M0_9ARAC|nr:hypothetical protein CDAR_526491 [Caerostris darwini]
MWKDMLYSYLSSIFWDYQRNYDCLVAFKCYVIVKCMLNQDIEFMQINHLNDIQFLLCFTTITSEFGVINSQNFIPFIVGLHPIENDRDDFMWILWLSLHTCNSCWFYIQYIIIIWTSAENFNYVGENVVLLLGRTNLECPP